MSDIAAPEENQGVAPSNPPWTQELVRERVAEAILAADDGPAGYPGHLADAAIAAFLQVMQEVELLLTVSRAGREKLLSYGASLDDAFRAILKALASKAEGGGHE